MPKRATTKKPVGVKGYIEIKKGGFYHVREKNSQFSKSLGIPKKGERVAYLGKTDLLGWHKVYYNGQTGWLYKQAGKLVIEKE